jgi:UDPglucose 6-dehydrogenase
MKIGVIGLGMVGETVLHTMKFYHKWVKGYDKYKESDSFEEVCQADIIFLAVPTNSKNGRLDSSILNEVLENLVDVSYKGIVCIKSTVAINYLNEARRYPLRIVYMPEFLHERSRLSDFLSPDHVVMSGDDNDIEILKQAFPWIKKSKYWTVDDRTAEMSKLFINAFAAMKISFANEVSVLSNEIGADPVKIMEILRNNKRCAPEYTNPTLGPYDGSCLPKDTQELVNFSNKSIILRAVEEFNNKYKLEFKK